MAQTARVTQAAPGAQISGKTPLTRFQREERSRRTTLKHKESYRQATTYVRGAVEQGTLREAARLRRENIAAQTIAYRQRNADRNVAAVERRKAYDKLQSQQATREALVGQPIRETAAPVARSGFVLLGVFAALIIFYAIISNPGGFSGWLGGLGGFIATVSQNGPLFSKNPTGS